MLNWNECWSEFVIRHVIRMYVSARMHVCDGENVCMCEWMYACERVYMYVWVSI